MIIQGLKTGFWFGFFVLLMLGTSAAAHAATAPFYLSAAVNEGTSSLSNPVQGSNAQSGSQTELLLLATLELGSFTIETGGGWMHDKLTGTAHPTGFNPAEYELVTDAGIAELSPRYRILGWLELGPLVELLYGTDVSFAPGFGSSGNGTTWLGGGQALYAFKLEGAAIRAGARYVQSLSIANHTLQSVQATLQVGLPLL